MKRATGPRHIVSLASLCAVLWAGVALASDPKVSVRSEGSGDKKPLRYAMTEGQKTKQTVSITTDFSLKADGTDAVEFGFPTIEITVEQTVKKVEDSGLVTLEAKVVDADASDGKNVPGEVLEGAKRDMPTLEGLTWTITQDARGFVKDARLERPSGLADSMKGTVDEIEAGLATANMILPEEALGDGASWDVEFTQEVDGRKTDHTIRYELDSREGDTLTLSLTHTWKGEPPPFPIPGLPEEVKVSGKSSESRSEGKSVERLDRPWHSTRDVSGTTTNEYTAEVPDGPSKTFEVKYTSAEKTKTEE